MLLGSASIWCAKPVLAQLLRRSQPSILSKNLLSYNQIAGLRDYLAISMYNVTRGIGHAFLAEKYGLMSK